MIEAVRIPEISENVSSGKVVKVLVKKGDMVQVDDILIEFETEKALVEIPSTVAGKIVSLKAEEGMEMKVGDVIAEVETEEEGAGEKEDLPEAAPAKEKASDEQKHGQRPAEPSDASETESAEAEKTDEAQRPQRPPAETDNAETRHPPAPAAPSVRRFARELGVDIHAVKGSGPGGRITQDDVKAHVKKGASAGGPSPGETPDLPDFSRWGEIEAVELPAVRRLTATSTAQSWRLVPHVTQFDQADITDVERFIRDKGPKLQKAGVKLTLTAIMTCICAAALRKFPQFNASIDMANERLIYKKYVHIGIAADTERGLLVPVLRDADQKSIRQLAIEIADLAERARNKKIKPDEMAGGTFTISNQGGIGGAQFTPIVMWPQAAILGISRTAVMPMYIDDTFQPRSMLPLALSYDHRIIDGADAARFLKWICDSLAQPLNLHLE